VRHAPVRARFLAVYAALALVPLLWVAPRTSIYPRALLPDMVAGTAYRPYVKRALVPFAVRIANAAIPARAHESLRAWAMRSDLLQSRLGWDPEHATTFLIVLLVHWGALILFAASFQRLLLDVLPIGETVAFAGTGAILLLVPIHFGYQNFVYDFPALALFTLGLALLAERRRRAFFLLWPIGVLNKETFVLLAPVFWMTQRDLPSAVRARDVALQILSAAAIWALLGLVYHANRGTPLEWHLQRNLTFAPTRQDLLHAFVYWGFWVYAFLWFGEKRELAGAAIVVGGVLVGTTLFLGYINEHRDFYEVFPILGVMAVHTTLRLLARKRIPASLENTEAASD